MHAKVQPSLTFAFHSYSSCTVQPYCTRQSRVFRDLLVLMNAMGIQPVTTGLQTYRDVFKHIETAALDEEHTIIRTHVMLEVIWTLYEGEKALSDLYKNGTNTTMSDEDSFVEEHDQSHLPCQ